MKFIIGKKIEMTQKFLEDGTIVPVTRIQAGPCFVTKKIEYNNGADKAVQLAWEEIKASKLNNALKGFFKKIFNKEIGYRHLKEFRLVGNDPMFDKLPVGQKVDVSIFKTGEVTDVQGISRGLGFQGIVKRHHFHGHPSTHGHKDQLRMSGSIGAKGPAHVFKGTRMGGRMGYDNVTVHNLEVVNVDLANNELWLKGAVPGARHGILYIKAEGEFDLPAVPVEPEKPAEPEVKPAE